MNEFKYNIGPYEIFSGFISGLPFLFIIYIISRGGFTFDDFSKNIILDTSFSKLILLIIFSYLVGSIISKISYTYYKYAGKIFKKDYLFTEKTLLTNWDLPFKQIANKDLVKLTFEERLVFFIKRKYGEPKLSHINDYLLVCLRKESIANAIKAESFIALNIMHRNLSLGFLLLSLVFIYLFFLDKMLVFQDLLYFVFFLVISITTLIIAYTYRSWWTRESFLAFYNIEMEKISSTDNTNKKV